MLTASWRRPRPRVGFLPIGCIRNSDLQRDYELGRELAARIDAQVIESPLVWEQTEVLDAVARLQDVKIDMLVQYVLHGMSAEQQTLAGARCNVPTVIWALPTHYSFSSCVSAVGALRSRGRKVRMVLSPAGDPGVLSEIEMIARVGYTIAQLRHSRIGTIGGIFPNLPAAQYHRDVLADRLGPQIVHVPIARFKRFLADANKDDGAVRAELTRLRETFDVRVGDERLCSAIRFDLALRALVQEYRLAGVAMECHTELNLLFEINPCLGFADENRGYLIGCEGDVVMVVNMQMVQLLAGCESYLGDVLSLQDGILTLAHCGASCQFARGRDVAIIEQTAPDTLGIEIKLAMCVPTFPLDQVTLLRLHGRDLDRLHMARGKVVASETGERLTVRVQLDNPREFLDHVCGNHYLVALGDLTPQFKLLGEWMDITVIET